MELGQIEIMPVLPFKHKPLCTVEIVYTLTVVASVDRTAPSKEYKEDEYGLYPAFISFVDGKISFSPTAEADANQIYSVFVTGTMTDPSGQLLEETTRPFFVTVVSSLFTINTEPFISDFLG